MHFFFGALYLFVINSVFIALATYLMVKYLRFRTVSGISPETAKKRRNLISTVLTIVIIPSIWSAIVLVGNNNYERNVHSFVDGNRIVGSSYIYDYKVEGRKVKFSLAGEELSDSLRTDFFEKAAAYHLKPKSITISEHNFGLTQKEMESMMKEVTTKADEERIRYDSEIEALRSSLDSLTQRIQSLEAAQEPADSLIVNSDILEDI
jgi:hypothetical protein